MTSSQRHKERDWIVSRGEALTRKVKTSELIAGAFVFEKEMEGRISISTK